MRATRKNKKASTECDTFCKGFVQRQIKRVKTFRKALGKTFKIKDVGSDNAQMEKEFRAQCEKGYCNEGCMNTIFQDGSLPPSVIQSFKGTKENKALFKAMIETSRKGIFGKKKSVLKNSFYEGLPEKDVKRLKKEGATSGCTLMAM